MIIRLIGLLLCSSIAFADVRHYTQGSKISFERYFILDKRLLNTPDGYLSMSIAPNAIEKYASLNCKIDISIKYVPFKNENAAFEVQLHSLQAGDIIRQRIGIANVDKDATVTLDVENVPDSCAQPGFHKRVAYAFALKDIL